MSISWSIFRYHGFLEESSTDSCLMVGSFEGKGGHMNSENQIDKSQRQKTYLTTCAPIEDLDQTADSSSPI